MSLDIPRFKKKNFFHRYCTKILPNKKSSPQYQKGHQNMLIIHPNAEHEFAALVNDNVLSISKTLPYTKYDFTILMLSSQKTAYRVCYACLTVTYGDEKNGCFRLQ